VIDLDNIDDVLPLYNTFSSLIDEAWCCIDEHGIVKFHSQNFSEYIGINQSELKSLFQFNPEFSYLKWQEILESLRLEGDKVLKSQTLKNHKDLKASTIKLVNFPLQNNNLVLYIILNEKPKQSAKKSKEKEEVAGLPRQDAPYIYDDFSPNPVIYFDDNGHIKYANAIMLKYNDHVKEIDNVNKLFLESEIGPVLEGYKSLNITDKEVLVRLIMKVKSKFHDGYGRLSLHEERRIAKYRLEFLMSSNMHLVDDPLEKAMVELDRLPSSNESMIKDMLLDDLRENFSFDNIVTSSQKYKKVLEQAAQVADTDTTVLITGETGTGKELLSMAIYHLSDRSEEIIVKVNCASIPKELFESTLFGHEKGAFTGADKFKMGKFELANNGTIFLDEVGEIPLDLQSKLLRVLQEGEIERVGNPHPIKINVRVIAATNRDLKKMVRKKKFRSDLYYRLNVFPIHNLPLRDRIEDVPLLIKHFLEKYSRTTGKKVDKIRHQDLQILSNYNYPGNIRELENIIQRGVVLSSSENVELGFFKSQIISDDEHVKFKSYDGLIRDHLIEALKMSRGKVTGSQSAAELLEINGKTFASKIRKYNINPNEFKS